jgi:phosphoribosyl-dephospho-CoA transferase
MKIYFVYTGNTMDGSEISLSYKYQTTEIYYLIANNKSNQDLVGLDTKDNEGNLTLTLPKDETQISYTVIKKWNDSNNSDKVRPESIQVQLKADNKNYGQPITLNETNNWTYTWDNLPEKSSGNTIQYSIEELGDLSNYNVVYENKLQETIITNNLTIDIPVVKTWVGDKKESVVVRLLADGAEVNSVELTEKTNWQHTFSDLPKYNQNTGAEINYSIKEDAVDGYNSVITGSSEVGFTVTNTITGKTSVGVTKEWIGPAANSVTINLLADGIIVDSQVLNEKNNWQYTFTNLEKYKDGQEIKYTIEEVSIDGYSSVISGDSTNGFIVTNTNTEAIDIPVIKNWVGAAKESVVVRLLADGTEVNSVELTEKTNWQHTFSDLPKYNQNTGAEINYSIKEDAVDGYNSVITGSSEVGFTVTNTITGKTSVGVTKEWIGPAANSVTINLLADGIIVDSQVLNEKNNWQYTFTNLEKYKDGQEIKYTIKEVSIDGYSSVISGDSTNGFIVTNTNTETIDIPVIKNWVGAAKESVVVRLLADGTEVNSVELTEKTNWQHTFSDLPKYNQNTGAEINYSIKEDAVDGYNSVITGSSESGFTVTNTKISGKLEITKTDVADGTLLPNAGFRVYDENKSVIVEGYTNEQGVATFELGYEEENTITKNSMHLKAI